jgi:hypothetical protein
MRIQNKTDWVDHLLGILCVMFIWFCVLVVKEAKAHHDAIEPPRLPTWSAPEIPQCDKELWLRIKDGC